VEDQKFDKMSRRLAGVTSRRGVIRGAVALALGGLGVGAAMIGGQDAESALTCRALGRSCTRDGQCCGGVCRLSNRRRTCGCATGLTVCRNTCVDLKTDARNCGRCGRVCTGGGCVNGVCQSSAGTTPTPGGQPTAGPTADPTSAAAACANVDATSPFCLIDVDDTEHYGVCPLHSTLKVYSTPGVFTSCTTSANCNGLYRNCDLPNNWCGCVKSGKYFEDPNGLQTIQQYYPAAPANICVRHSNVAGECNGAGEILCSNLGTLCRADTDCCLTDAVCDPHPTAGGTCQFRDGAACTSNNDCLFNHPCVGNVCSAS
jgi:hypothetical protein